MGLLSGRTLAREVKEGPDRRIGLWFVER